MKYETHDEKGCGWPTCKCENPCSHIKPQTTPKSWNCPQCTGHNYDNWICQFCGASFPEKRAKVLDELTAETERLGLYDKN